MNALVEDLSLRQAVDSLRAGGLLAHSTTSLLGIGAHPHSFEATRRLDQLKRRAPGRGYVHVISSSEQARDWVDDLSLARSLWDQIEGPLTLVLNARDGVPVTSRADDGTVAIRLDRHPVVASLCDRLECPLISTSLNWPSEPPITDVSEVPEALARQLAGSFVRPPSPLGGSSTLVRLRDDGSWRVLRAGPVSEDELTAHLGRPRDVTR